MAVPVNIYVHADDALHSPLAGVTVGVFDPTSGAMVGQSSTDSDGLAEFLLPGTPEGLLYQVRLYKLGVIFNGARGIAVLDPTATTNKFDAYGTVLTMPVATDPKLCRCTGRFVNFANKPIPHCVVRISARAEFGFETPKVVDGNMVASESMHFQTDDQGFLTIDLFRGGRYWVTFAGEDDAVWPLVVPDRSAANLIELIHPTPVAVIWNQDVAPNDAIQLHVGDNIIVPFAVVFSNFEVVTADLASFVDISSSDALISVDFSNQTPNCLSITAVSPGTATITVDPKPGLQPARSPAPTTLLPLLTVTVQP